jgi:methylglutaconyl-CoA hydratase
MGARAARRYFTTAEVIDAPTALELGLLSQVVGVDELDGAVDALVETLLANGPRAIRAAKALVLDYAGRAIDGDMIEDSCRRIADIRVSEEGQAGLQAFLEKAEPPWRAGRV